MTDDATLKAYALFNTGYFINGQWHTSDTTFDVENPATGEVLARVAKAGKTETDAAIAAAAKAFPAWRAKTAKERSEVLYRWYQLIMENQAYLAKLRKKLFGALTIRPMVWPRTFIPVIWRGCFA